MHHRAVVGEARLQAPATTTESRTEKVSVSLPTGLTGDVRTRVGSRGFSGYVARAVRRQLERDNLDALLAEMELANGPVPVVILTSDPDDLGLLTRGHPTVAVHKI